MSISFRPARRSEAKPLIGLYAESGMGKTWSSLLLARGYVGPQGTIGMIETEGGRGEAYVGRAPVGDYLVCPIRGNFAPAEFGKAISQAEDQKFGALIIDSASAEWEGVGGVLSMAAENQAKGIKGVLVWQQPKIQHQREFMLRLMQTPIPLVIVCMRAKYPMEQQPNKEWARSKTLEPKQADDILFEMFVHAWIDSEHRANVTKYTLPELQKIIVDKEPITIETGKNLAVWARSESTAAPTVASNVEAARPVRPAAPAKWPPTAALEEYPTAQIYWKNWEEILAQAPDPIEVRQRWESQTEKDVRHEIDFPDTPGLRAKDLAANIGAYIRSRA